jgi:hypothetical protein
MHTIFSRTLGSKGIFLNSPSASIVFYILLEVLPCTDLILQKVHIFVAYREALLHVSAFLLAAKDGYDTEGRWYFKTEVC